jgi:putative ABC transport system permease protein
VDVGEVWVKFEDKRFKHKFTWVDSSFISFFSFPLIAGDPNTLLDDPMSVVISEDVAKKFFGEDQALGKVLNFGSTNHTVTGVIGEIPGNSSFDLEIVTPLTTQFVHESLGGRLWGAYEFRSFIKLFHANEITALKEQAQLIMDKYVHDADRGNVLFLALNEYYHEFSNQREYVSYLLLVAISILLIASINYANLATAQSLTRTTEVGVRKFVGATKSSLVALFICESLTVTAIALILGGFIAEILLPILSTLVGLEIHINFINNPELIAAIVGLGIIVGIISGSYPAFYVSSLNPSAILRRTHGNIGKMTLRNSLVILQFSVAIFLLSAVTLVVKQVRYMKTYDMRFDRSNVVALPTAGDNSDTEDPFSNSLPFKEQLKQLPGVISVTASSFIPGDHLGGWYYFLPLGNENIIPHKFNNVSIEADFFDTYGIKIKKGRNFIPQSHNDNKYSVILNEAAVDKLGLMDPVGEKLMGPYDEPVEIIGVVENYNYSSLKEFVKPMVHFYKSDSGLSRFISIKIAANAQKTTLEQIHKTWDGMNFDKKFEYFFPAERMKTLYAAEDALMNILVYASSFAIFIACLGLYSLASFSIALRTKEIAIRKVLGASLSTIVRMFSKSYFKMVLISIIIAVPFVRYVMLQWLQGFAFRIEIGWLIFALVGLLVILVSFVMISIHSIKAGLTNPIDSLRSE